jgi:hypothetical protein
MSMKTSKEMSPVKTIQSNIVTLPNRPPFMLAQPLAQIYQVEPEAINRAVKRNPDKFPDDFCFQLSESEWEVLRSQNVTASGVLLRQNGGAKLSKIRFSPYGFTHYGANMLASVLRSKVATERCIQIMRVFSEMEHRELSVEKKKARIHQAQLALDYQARIESKVERRELTDAIKRLVEWAGENNPESNAERYYVIFTKMVATVLFNLRKFERNLRDEIPASALRKLQMVESAVATWLNEELDKKPDYHEPYRIIKERTKKLVDLIGQYDLSVPA